MWRTLPACPPRWSTIGSSARGLIGELRGSVFSRRSGGVELSSALRRLHLSPSRARGLTRYLYASFRRQSTSPSVCSVNLMILAKTLWLAPSDFTHLTRDAA